ncbi:hypothetical protein EVAR_25313_1 [Eumeta japonica]|uniref:Uncharacterized protein n=1 Tax=Eumeta variegata TaxID=151549 RepID=A0A4C1VPJ4_EUMVA|nr:hypothetical protein EVAR_25313_1 [Eumeta japonica]
MVIAKDVFTANCKRLTWKGKSDGIREIRGINTSSSVPHPRAPIITRPIAAKFKVLQGPGRTAVSDALFIGMLPPPGRYRRKRYVPQFLNL